MVRCPKPTTSTKKKKTLTGKLKDGVEASKRRTVVADKTTKILHRSKVNIVKHDEKYVDLTKKLLNAQEKQLNITNKMNAYRAKMATTLPKQLEMYKKQALPMSMLPGVTPLPKKMAPGLPGLGATALPMSMLPGVGPAPTPGRQAIGMPPGLPEGKPSLINKTLSSLGKLAPLLKKASSSFLAETGKRNKSHSLGVKSAISTVASFFLLKKILGKLQESSGYLGAVFKILSVAFKLALMPIATVLGAFLMPYTLQILDALRGMLTAIKGPLADLIGGKISIAEFLEVALPAMGEAFKTIGSVIGSAIIGFLDLVGMVWPKVEPYFLKAFDAIAGFIETTLWPKLEPLLIAGFDKFITILDAKLPDLAERVGEGLGKALITLGPPIFKGILSALWIAFKSFIMGLCGMSEGIISAFGLTFNKFIIGLELLILGVLVAITLFGTSLPAALILGIGFILAMLFVVQAKLAIMFWGWVANLAATGLKFIYDLGATFGKWVYDIGAAFGSFISNLKSTLKSIPSLILNAAKSAIGIGGGSKASSVAAGATTGVATGGKKGGIGGLIGGLIGKLPFFADGGIATKPTAGIFGENGPEALVPLKKGGMGGNYTFNISIDQPQISSDMDIDEIARRVSDQIYSNVRRSTSW